MQLSTVRQENTFLFRCMGAMCPCTYVCSAHACWCVCTCLCMNMHTCGWQSSVLVVCPPGGNYLGFLRSKLSLGAGAHQVPWVTAIELLKSSCLCLPLPRAETTGARHMPGSNVSVGDPTQDLMLDQQAFCQRILSPGRKEHMLTLAGYSRLLSRAQTLHLTSLDSGSSCPSAQTRSGL